MQADLFPPLRIKDLVLRNRLVMAPMGVCLASERGAVTPQLIEFYRERAKRGWVPSPNCDTISRREGRKPGFPDEN